MRSVKGGARFGPGQWKELREAIAAGKDVDYEGAANNSNLDDAGDCPSPYDIWRIESGQVVVKETGVVP